MNVMERDLVQYDGYPTLPYPTLDMRQKGKLYLISKVPSYELAIR